jgi:uncharacterized protein DUF992
MNFAGKYRNPSFHPGNSGYRAAFMQGRPAIAPSPPSPEETDMKTFRLMLGAAVAVAGLAIASTADAAPHGVRVGDLTCNVASGWGFVFGSSKDLHCTYRGNGHREHYVGSISKFGVDIGYTEGGVLVWGVFAPTSDMRKGALSGDYAGATAQATVAVGVGANVLLGGLDKSIALQPLSVEGSKGLNVAAGIGAISLRESP